MSNLNVHILARNKLKKVDISYKFQATELGNVLVGFYDGKICHISFQDGDSPNFDGLKQDFPQSNLREDYENVTDGSGDFFKGNANVLLVGTEFQVKVWKTLTEIDKGKTVSYERVAELIGNSKAVRAVANAVAKNKIAYLIPCHRVINKNGRINKYRWGTERKKMLLNYDKSPVLQLLQK